MEDSMIKCQTCFNGETCKKALQSRFKYMPEVKIYQFLGVVIILMSIFIFILARGNGHDNSYILTFGFIGLTFLFYPRFLVYNGMRRIKISPFYGKEISWEITDSLSASAEGFNSSTKLEMHYQVFFTKDGILIYPEKDLFHWLPREGFQDEESFMQAKALIASKIDKSKLKIMGKGAGKSEMQKDKSAAKV